MFYYLRIHLELRKFISTSISKENVISKSFKNKLFHNTLKRFRKSASSFNSQNATCLSPKEKIDFPQGPPRAITLKIKEEHAGARIRALQTYLFTVLMVDKGALNPGYLVCFCHPRSYLNISCLCVCVCVILLLYQAYHIDFHMAQVAKQKSSDIISVTFLIKCIYICLFDKILFGHIFLKARIVTFLTQRSNSFY